MSDFWIPTAGDFPNGPPSGGYTPSTYKSPNPSYDEGVLVPGTERTIDPFTGQVVPVTSGAGGSAQPTPQQQASAKATIKNLLAGYGLDSDKLVDEAWRLKLEGYDQPYIDEWLRGTSEFKDRFSALAIRQSKGLPPISPTEYINLEKDYDAAMNAAGIHGMFDRKDLYTKWISGDVSAAEAGSRAQLAYQAAMGEPVEVRAEMQRLYGPAAAGMATAYYLDPTNSLPEAKRRIQAGELAGASSMTGYGLLTKEEAESLASLGITQAQGRDQFGQLAADKELFAPLPGEQGGGIDRQAQLAAAFRGDVAARQAIENERRQRLGTFQGNAGYGRTQQGVSGLGATSSQ